ncbi:MAG: 2-oxo-4-hydroxy-4-carboxy-5-ureidoimidazoline decarboxylase [Limnohabitans sp.]|jgi:N-carbamoyl-L-amino-acid hydrolase|uniref:2-oxo-4-hydroxy-4-carboxy-5-ureidoimidazoline decarboxylase n=1 Tax=Limnohabitans sp. TaxID=1907725 RepID=UPI0025F598BF|nr:2-oxo-4-hydroxy-4-carboxy-5-ureidoimidazoline decarboxylase [Limnohabitans sp.]MCO4089315.1 2-oxo-4-hydroxy-4-carboxy-5-ureidoimidazoline decarboxylase [Limnohabitans sp.]
MALTLEQLNSASREDAAQMLDGLYEHSPWIAEQALNERPFTSLAHLKHAMCEVLAHAGRDAQLGLIRAHPELAGKAMVSKTLTAESTNEQSKAGLTDCTPEEFAKIQKLNADYNAKFGWPFILAVRGPRGVGLRKKQIIEAFERRLFGHPDMELAECLRNIHRIVEIRLNDKFGVEPTLGHQVWDWQEKLAQHSDPGFAEKGQLTVTYLTDAHRACAQRITQNMRDCGFDEVFTDAVGNVVGRYHPATAGANEPAPGRPKLASAPLGGSEPHAVGSVGARYLMTGSHYDTVRNGGKYDGRLGIFVPMACVQQLHQQGKRLPFGIEVVAFAEEEGQRYKATFLGSGALIGQFNPAWLDQQDADGITMRAAMQHAGLCIDDIPKIQRDPAQYLGFIEVHIEQGPVLNEVNIPLGVVTSINGSVRYLCEVFGTASHAGTTPMDRRRDAACAVAELALYMEQRATQDGDSVATIGQLQVPNGSINVVPGRCLFSLDMRAPTDAQRDALVADVMAQLDHIAERRGVRVKTELTMSANAAPSAPEWQARWERAVSALGVPLFKLPSGAGHDAMKLHEVMPQAMLFVRGENGGISHNPRESTTSDDMQLCVDAFTHVLNQLTTELS